MSKSLGNFFTIREVLQQFDGETIRFFVARTHYRSPLNYSDAHLEDARGGLKRLYTALAAVPHELPTASSLDWSNAYAMRFQAAMNNDFATPEAVAVLFDLAGDINRSKDAELAQLLRQLGGVLGLLQADAQSYLQGAVSLDKAAIEEKIAQRQSAKAACDFALADAIRQELLVQGIVLKDAAEGTTWTAA